MSERLTNITTEEVQDKVSFLEEEKHLEAGESGATRRWRCAERPLKNWYNLWLFLQEEYSWEYEGHCRTFLVATE